MEGGIPLGEYFGSLTFPSVYEYTTYLPPCMEFAQVAATLNCQPKLINTWLMVLNVGKSCVMWFCPPRPKLSHLLSDTVINNITLKSNRHSNIWGKFLIAS